MTIIERIERDLFANQDPGYKAFHSKLVPNLDPDTIIGVRTPVLKKLAKQYAKDPEIRVFLEALPHRYYEMNNLHGFIIMSLRDYDSAVREINALLPYVDNWATCDLLRPKAFIRHRNELEQEILHWMASEETYTIRFGMEMIMTHFLDADFRSEWLSRVAEIQSEEYYIRMMQAWFFATALAKQWDAALPFLENRCLSTWVHNKTIQKSVESYRISEEHKTFLKSLR